MNGRLWSTVRVLVLFSLVLVLAGCFGGSGSGGGGGMPPLGPSLTELRIAPTVVDIPVDASEPLTATAVFSNGSFEDVTDDADWSVTDDTIARIDQESGVRVEGLSEGVTVIEARFGGAVARAEVRVGSGDVASLRITWEGREEGDTAPPALAQGEVFPLIAVATFADGAERDVTERTTWTSSAPAVADVGSASNLDLPMGAVRGRTRGSAAITAEFGDETDNVAVTVDDRVISDLRIEPTSAIIDQGAVIGFRAFAVSAGEPDRDVTSQVQWSVTDNAIAVIRNSPGNRGRAAGLEDGNTQVTARFGFDPQGLSATAPLRVNSAPNAPRRLLLTAQPNVLLVGEASDTAELVARVQANDSVNGAVPQNTPVRFVQVVGSAVALAVDPEQTVGTVAGEASTTATPAAAGLSLILAGVPDTLAEGGAFVRVVSDFSEIILPAVATQGGILRFIAFNVSNRDFRFTRVEVFYDGNRIVDGEVVDDVLEGEGAKAFDQPLRDGDDITLYEAVFHFEDEATGSEFTVEFNLQPGG